MGESAIKHFDQIGKEVTHKYLVENRGPWRVDELQVQVEWPYQVENGKAEGKWLLYMTEHPTVDGELLPHCHDMDRISQATNTVNIYHLVWHYKLPNWQILKGTLKDVHSHSLPVLMLLHVTLHFDRK